MKPTVTVTFDADIEPAIERREGSVYVCKACCALVRLCAVDEQTVESWCPAGHPSVMMRDGKVIGTSA